MDKEILKELKKINNWLEKKFIVDAGMHKKIVAEMTYLKADIKEIKDALIEPKGGVT